MAVSERFRQLLRAWPDWVLDGEDGQPLGSGTNGIVYRVRHKRTGVKAAVKWISIPGHQQGDEEIMAGATAEEVAQSYSLLKDRFLQEAEIMRRLGRCPQIVRIEEPLARARKDETGYDILIRMELLSPLKKLFPDNRMDEAEALRLGVSICQALAYCHRQGIIHRDVKAANLFVDSLGNYKLGDFGTARQMDMNFGASTRIGTPAYMAPEMFFPAARYGADVDTYALATVLYRALNGGRPVLWEQASGASAAERSQQAQVLRLSGAPIPPAAEASREMNAILLKALSFQPAGRYPNADAMLADLRRLQGSRTPVPAPQTEQTQRMSWPPAGGTQTAWESEPAPAKRSDIPHKRQKAAL